jgi:hypothetical protein
MRPYLDKPITKKGWWSGSRGRLWVQAPVPQKKKEKSWVWWHRPIILAEAGGSRVWGQLRLHSETLSQKNKGQGCSSVVQCLPSMHKALGLTPPTPHTQRENTDNNKHWQECGKIGTHIHADRNVSWRSHSGRQSGSSSKVWTWIFQITQQYHP